MGFQAYNKQSVHNLQLRESAQILLDDGCITPPQYEALKTAFPVVFKQSNLFVRVGLFLFTCLCLLFGAGLFGLMTLGSGGTEAIGFILLMFAFVVGCVTEMLIRSNNLYRQGSDNALIYATILSLMSSIAVILKIEIPLTISLISVFVLSLATWRYGDPFLAVLAFLGFLFSIFLIIKNAEMNLAAIPLSLAIISVSTYFFVKNCFKNESLFYWKDCFEILEKVSLLTIYASTNYFVIHQLAMQMDSSFEVEPLPLSFVFSGLTTLLPFVYIYFGVKNRDRTLWIAGAIIVLMSVLTFKYYHHVLPLEWSLLIAGTLLLGIGFLLLQYLKTPKNGFSNQPERGAKNPYEALIISQVLQHSHAMEALPDSEIPPQFGGGDFGGGGASGEF